MATDSSSPVWEHRRVVSARAIDGDTIEAELDLGFGIRFIGRFRVRGFYAPEMREAGGPEAKVRAQELLDSGVAVLRSHKGQTFGRWLADLELEGGRDFVREMGG